MARTIDEWVDDADDLIRRYAAWKRSGLEQVLNPPTGSSPNRLEVEVIADKAGRYADQARKLLEKPSAELERNADHKLDLLDIVEDGEIGAAEGAAMVDPDTVFASADRQTKIHVTNKMRLSREQVDLLRARLRGDRRGEPSTAPAKEPPPGNGNPPR